MISVICKLTSYACSKCSKISKSYSTDTFISITKALAEFLQIDYNRRVTICHIEQLALIHACVSPLLVFVCVEHSEHMKLVGLHRTDIIAILQNSLVGVIPSRSYNRDKI